MTAPIVSWYEATNEVANEVKSTINYGVVDTDNASATKVFYIWNNRGGSTNTSKMEDVVFTTRDREGGMGDQTGKIVEAVRDMWFQVRCDSLGESAFVPVGKGGVGTANPTGTKDLGTNGTTTNLNEATAQAWVASTVLSLGTYIKPTVANGYIYEVTAQGTTGGTQPTWLTVDGNTQVDGTVEFTAHRIINTPNAKEILGLANNTLPDGSNDSLAGGNFVKISVFAEVPINATSGRNLLVSRVSYRFV